MSNKMFFSLFRTRRRLEILHRFRTVWWAISRCT